MTTLSSPLQGTVVRAAAIGDVVAAGQPVVVVESMKLEHSVPAPADVAVTVLHVAVGDLVAAGDRLAEVEPAGAAAVAATGATSS